MIASDAIGTAMEPLSGIASGSGLTDILWKVNSDDLVKSQNQMAK